MLDRELIPEAGPRHPVLCALAQLREELNQLFEDQRSLLLRREPHAAVEVEAIEAALPEAASELVVESVPAPSEAVEDPAPRERERKRNVAAAAERPLPPPRPREEPAAPPVAAATATTTTTTEPVPAARSDDPRQRLDALARLLDKRAKQSTSAPVEPGAKSNAAESSSGSPKSANTSGHR